MVKLRAGRLNLDKNELLYTNSQEFFPDFRNISFSEHHLNECFCSGFIFRLQCISPASDAKSFRLEIRLKKCVTNLKMIIGKLKNNKIPKRNSEN